MSDAQVNEGGSAPRRVGRRDPSKLVFDWNDGVTGEASAAVIRRGCACAVCVDEHTGRPLLDQSTVPDDLTHTQVSLMGNYALAITFSDGHRTGIFTWRSLRQLTGS